MKENIQISAIHLVRLGDNIIVKIEYNDNWFEVISEHFDGSFSHIVETGGMLKCISDASKKVSIDKYLSDYSETSEFIK